MTWWLPPSDFPVDSTFEQSQAINAPFKVQRAIEEHGGMGYVKGINAAAGQFNGGFGPCSRSASGTNVAEVVAQLVPLGDRDFSGKANLSVTWREEVGELLGVENSKFSYAIGQVVIVPLMFDSLIRTLKH